MPDTKPLGCKINCKRASSIDETPYNKSYWVFNLNGNYSRTSRGIHCFPSNHSVPAGCRSSMSVWLCSCAADSASLLSSRNIKIGLLKPFLQFDGDVWVHSCLQLMKSYKVELYQEVLFGSSHTGNQSYYNSSYFLSQSEIDFLSENGGSVTWTHTTWWFPDWWNHLIFYSRNSSGSMISMSLCKTKCDGWSSYEVCFSSHALM